MLRILHEGTGSLFELRKANRIVSGKIDCLEKREPESIYRDDGRTRLPENILMRHLEQELTRRKAVEEKAKANVLGITLAFSAIFAGSALSSSISGFSGFDVDWLVCVLVVSLLTGALFLLIGGGLALSALRVAKIYTLTLEDEVGNTTVETKGAKYIWCVELNQMTTLLKTNQIDASYSCIRNGVFALAVVALVFALSALRL